MPNEFTIQLNWIFNAKPTHIHTRTNALTALTMLDVGWNLPHSQLCRFVCRKVYILHNFVSSRLCLRWPRFLHIFYNWNWNLTEQTKRRQNRRAKLNLTRFEVTAGKFLSVNFVCFPSPNGKNTHTNSFLLLLLIFTYVYSKVCATRKLRRKSSLQCFHQITYLFMIWHHSSLKGLTLLHFIWICFVVVLWYAHYLYILLTNCANIHRAHSAQLQVQVFQALRRAKVVTELCKPAGSFIQKFLKSKLSFLTQNLANLYNLLGLNLWCLLGEFFCAGI